MKKLLLTTALLALATPALAQIGGDSITGNSGVAVNGTVQNSTINNGPVGPGAGSTFAPSVTANPVARVDNDFSPVNVVAPVTKAETGPVTVNTKVEGDKVKLPRQAPAVFAPGLANGYDCNGSASFGGSIAGFGIGGGSTVVSEVCENVFLSRELERKGDKDASWGVLCEIDKVRKHSSKCPVLDEDVEAVVSSEYPSMRYASPARH